MDLDIFKRKVMTRGYSYLSVESGFVIYKPLTVSNEKGTIELTVQSNTLSDKSRREGLQLTISRFLKEPRGEIIAATIICNTLEEMSLACVQVDLLASDSMKSPFEEALTGENLKYRFKRTSWVRK